MNPFRWLIPAEQHQRVLEFTHGYPLALSLVADAFAQNPSLVFKPETAPDLIKSLLDHFVEKVPGPAQRSALEACALVRLTTEPLLAALLNVPDAHELFAWLRNLSFVNMDRFGLFPHDLVREALAVDWRWRNADWYMTLHTRARQYYLSQWERYEGLAQQVVLFDYVYLHRDNPMVWPFFEWKQSGTVFTDRLQAGDAARGANRSFIFQPAPTQEEAAELIDVPFSTYRRHLRAGLDYVVAVLWQQELMSEQ